jgi:hypothetical protein
MSKRLWVWREVVPTDAPGDYYTNMDKLTTTGRAFVMRSPEEIEGPTEILGVFDSFEAAMKVVEIGNER